MDLERIEKAVREILLAVGEDPEREGLQETPNRVARMYAEIFSGLKSDPKQHLKIFHEEGEHDELVFVRDIPLYSVCEHHLLPFIGKCHIAYIPRDGKIRYDGILRGGKTLSAEQNLCDGHFERDAGFVFRRRQVF